MLRVVRIERERMVIRTEEWLAPALNCYALKRTVFRGSTEADLYLSNLDEAFQVTVGEPVSSLFEKPSAYVERSPLQKREEFNRRYPETVCSSLPVLPGPNLQKRRRTIPQTAG